MRTFDHPLNWEHTVMVASFVRRCLDHVCSRAFRNDGQVLPSLRIRQGIGAVVLATGMMFKTCNPITKRAWMHDDDADEAYRRCVDGW